MTPQSEGKIHVRGLNGRGLSGTGLSEWGLSGRGLNGRGLSGMGLSEWGLSGGGPQWEGPLWHGPHCLAPSLPPSNLRTFFPGQVQAYGSTPSTWTYRSQGHPGAAGGPGRLQGPGPITPLPPHTYLSLAGPWDGGLWRSEAALAAG
ncbi:unnamed protein product [Gadus morhua 'NCC']